jgi:hypothetical protein
MSSNELYQGVFTQDFTLASGTKSANLANYFQNCSKIVGVSLKTAGADTATTSNNPANIYVGVVTTAGAAGVLPVYTCTLKNNKNSTDEGTYTLSWVNEFKAGLCPC